MYLKVIIIIGILRSVIGGPLLFPSLDYQQQISKVQDQIVVHFSHLCYLKISYLDLRNNLMRNISFRMELCRLEK